MIVFLVPVKSKKLSSDWDVFSKSVHRSLKSITGQKDPNFQVVVACHELPTKRYEHEKIHYVQVDFEPPILGSESKESTRLLNNLDESNRTFADDKREIDRRLKEEDKSKKILNAYNYAEKNFSANYYMVVDSDDCIHRKISEFVNSRIADDSAGWYFKKGYYYREGKKLAFLNKQTFNEQCGSCIIIKKEFFKYLIIDKPFLYYFHEKIEFIDNFTLKPFPLAGTIYSMANGENHLMSQNHISNLVNRPKISSFRYLKSIFSKLSKYRPRLIGLRFKRTYNFYYIS